MSLRGTEKVATDVTTGSATKPRALGSLTGKRRRRNFTKTGNTSSRRQPFRRSSMLLKRSTRLSRTHAVDRNFSVGSRHAWNDVVVSRRDAENALILSLHRERSVPNLHYLSDKIFFWSFNDSDSTILDPTRPRMSNFDVAEAKPRKHQESHVNRWIGRRQFVCRSIDRRDHASIQSTRLGSLRHLDFFIPEIREIRATECLRRTESFIFILGVTSRTIEVRNHKRVKDQLDDSRNLSHTCQFEASHRWCRGEFCGEQKNGGHGVRLAEETAPWQKHSEPLHCVRRSEARVSLFRYNARLISCGLRTPVFVRSDAGASRQHLISFGLPALIHQQAKAFQKLVAQRVIFLAIVAQEGPVKKDGGSWLAGKCRAAPGVGWKNT